ncbi:MAG: RES domain-containing protein [Bryobacteraceae bacterium]
MPALYRVFPFLADSAANEPGGALYVPPQGGGRLDNPGIYSVLYLSDAAAGAIAEAFGRFAEWTPAILDGSPSLPGSVRAIARYALPEKAPLCNLDDPEQLRNLGLRPSEVVSRNYGTTRAWARRIYEQNMWMGVRWWSYYDPRWASIGLWRVDRLVLEEVQLLRLDDAALMEASRAIVRRIVPVP